MNADLSTPLRLCDVRVMLQVSEATIHQLRREGYLRATRLPDNSRASVRGAYQFDRSDVEKVVRLRSWAIAAGVRVTGNLLLQSVRSFYAPPDFSGAGQ